VTDAAGAEWFWDGDPVFWSGRAPILFPTVGALNRGVARFGGREYPMAQHGFARHGIFTLAHHTEASATFRLEDDSTSRIHYPFAFNLDVTHQLDGATLATIVSVTNHDSVAMPTGVGFHPALRWPLPSAGKRDDHIIRFEVDEAELKIEYTKVTPETRIPALLQNRIDLECGSTTANAERSKRVAFSPLMFVAGTKLMVAKASPIQSITDMRGKTVVVTKGTTNEQALHAADAKFGLGLKIVTADDHEQSYQMLSEQKVDAFATDDVLLYGLIARHKAQDKFRVTGDYLSYDPYGIMFRKGEPQMAQVVERAFRKLATNHDLLPLYNKWFVARLPTGERLGIPISPQLEEAFKVLDDSGG